MLLAAGLLAKKAVERGLTVEAARQDLARARARAWSPSTCKAAGLLPYLEQLGFYVAGYGCTTCIGNAGPLAEPIEEAIVEQRPRLRRGALRQPQLRGAHPPNMKANFLASPPLVVAFAIAGTVLKDLMTEPLGMGKDGKPVFLKDIWPTSDEVHALHASTRRTRQIFRRLYGDLAKDNPLWSAVPTASGPGLRLAEVDLHRRAAVLRGLRHAARARRSDVKGARALGIFGDSVTTDHISPGRLDQGHLARRQVPHRERRA